MEQRVEEEKRGGGEWKGNEVEEGERERGGVGGGEMTESGGREGHMFCERIENIKTSAATFQVLLYCTLLNRRGDDISYNILPQYSYQCPLHALTLINVQIKHSTLNFIIWHYIIYNPSYELDFQHHVCNKK